MIKDFVSRRFVLAVGVLSLLILLFVVPASAATTVASDSAGPYPSDWLTNQNFGFGFYPWSLNASDPQYADFFMGSSTQNGDNNGDGDIDTAGRAWGMFAHSGANAFARRSFITPLQVDETIHIEMDNGAANAGNVGFQLETTPGAWTVAFELPAASPYRYRIVDAAGAIYTPFTRTVDGLAIDITIVSGGRYNATITRLIDGATYQVSNRPLRFGTSPINGLALYNVNAGFSSSSLYFNNIEVTHNDAPVAADDSYTADEDTTLNVAAPGVLYNDSDGDGDPLALTLDATVSSGSLTLNADGSFEYVPDADFCGQDSFTYHVNDGDVDSGAATVTIDVICVNDAPVVDLNGSDSLGIDFALSYTAGDGPVLVEDIDMTVTDIDGSIVGSASSGDLVYVVTILGQIWEIDSNTGDMRLVSGGSQIIRARMMDIDSTTQELFVVDDYRDMVIKVDINSGAETVFSTGYVSPWGIAVESNGDILVTDPSIGRIFRIYDRSSGAKTVLSSWSGSGSCPWGIEVEASGSILVTDRCRRMIHRVNPSSGARTPLTSPFTIDAFDIAAAPNGDIFVSNLVNQGRLTRVDSISGAITVLPYPSSGSLVTTCSYGIDVDGDGNVVTADYCSGSVAETDATSGAQAQLARVPWSQGLAVDPGGSDTEGTNDVIVSAQVKIISPPDGADEVLAVGSPNPNVTASYDGNTGILSLVGDDTAAGYEAILRSVTYDNLSSTPTAGNRTIEFTASDGDATSEVAVTILLLEVPNTPPVAEAGGPYQVDEGGSIALSGSVTDPDAGDTHAFEWDLDYDGATFDVDAAGASPTFDATNLDGPDSRTVALRVSDSYGAAHTDTAEVTINNVAPSATFNAPVAVDEGSDINLSLTGAADPAIADTFEYTFDCGDGSGYGAFGSASSATCPTDDDGSRTVLAKIMDDDGGVNEYTANVTINNVAPTIALGGAASVDEGSSYALTLGTVTDPGDDTISQYVVHWGDGDSDTFNVNGVVNHTYDDGPDSPTITVDLVDEDGAHVNAGSLALTVNNVTPSVDSISVPAEPVNINEQPINASATFSDPAGMDDEPYTCAVDYGDGAGFKAGAIAGTTCVGPDQAYTEAGVYQVIVAVTDKDGGTGAATAVDFIVIYDPSGGFVTGGGWIMSPEGACPAGSICEGATGKANFGFVSKYKRGANVPTGNTEFNFQAGDLNFHSDTYEWLVVNQAGTNAQFKGVGDVNGQGEYQFMIWATDGGSDTFRIKIWDDNTGDIVYDNGFDQAIGGGNIKVHDK